MFNRQDLDRYAGVLGEIKVRVDAVRALPRLWEWQVTEAAALHMRKVLELLVLGSLVTHRVALGEVASAFHTHDAGSARKLVRRANPEYWPVPVKSVARADAPDELVTVETGFLREDEWGPAYGHLSELLHARNPFAQPLSVQPQQRRILALAGRVVVLLNHHLVKVANAPVMLSGHMHVDNGRIQVVVFRRVDE